MSRPPSSATGRGLAALAGLALLTILDHLSRKGRRAMSTAVSGPESPRPSADAHGRQSVGPAPETGRHHGDTAPGEQRPGSDVRTNVRTYLIGLGLAALLTAASFAVSYTDLIYGPGVPVALIVFALAQVGVHLVFFLHLTTGPENINNALALAFGTLIVLLLVGGTLWIMMHMNQNMMPTGSPHMRHP